MVSASPPKVLSKKNKEEKGSKYTTWKKFFNTKGNNSEKKLLLLLPTYTSKLISLITSILIIFLKKYLSCHLAWLRVRWDSWSSGTLHSRGITRPAMVSHPKGGRLGFSSLLNTFDISGIPNCHHYYLIFFPRSQVCLGVPPHLKRIGQPILGWFQPALCTQE